MANGITWLWIVALFLAVVTIGLPLWATLRRRAVATRQSRAPGQIVKLPSGNTHFQWIGPETGPVVVCVHGLSTPSPVFSQLADELVAYGHRVLIYDQYGHGFSDRIWRRSTLTGSKRQLAALLDDQSVNDPILLLGYSMGGLVATSWAADHPQRVARLILLAPAGLGHLLPPFQTWCAKTPIVGAWAWTVFGGMALRRGTDRPKGFPQLSDIIAEETHTRGTLRAIRSAQRQVLSQHMTSQHRTVARHGIPVLAIWGGEDDVIPLSSLGRLTQANRAARQEVIETADHGLPYSHPQDVAQIILSWMGEERG